MSAAGVDWIRRCSPFALGAVLVQLEFGLMLNRFGLVELVLDLALLVRSKAAQAFLGLFEVGAAVPEQTFGV
jgi:hypothetical protein